MSWGDSQPHYPGPEIRGAEPRAHEGWPADEQDLCHAECEPCRISGCELELCIESAHDVAIDCGLAECDVCERGLRAPARRQAADDAREGYGDWLRDEGKDARGSM